MGWASILEKSFMFENSYIQSLFLFYAVVNFSTYDSDICCKRKTISRNNNLDICKFDYTGNYNSANERLKKRKSHPLEKVCSAQKHDKQNMTQHTQQLNLPNINGRGNAPAAGAMTQHATDYRLYNIYIYMYIYIHIYIIRKRCFCKRVFTRSVQHQAHCATRQCDV